MALKSEEILEVEVINLYARKIAANANSAILSSNSISTPSERLHGYFQAITKDFADSNYERGCLLKNFSDAAHCFPPDISQGVNSALEDVYIFQNILAETCDDLDQSLPSYQDLRQPDIQALIRLVQISYPWQYNQDPVQNKIWGVNFLIRLGLSRLFPLVFSPHSILLIQNHELSYSEILVLQPHLFGRLFIG